MSVLLRNAKVVPSVLQKLQHSLRCNQTTASFVPLANILHQKISIQTVQLQYNRVNKYGKDSTGVLSSTFHTSARREEHAALAVLENVKELRKAPPIALVLGVAGLCPFIAPPALMISSGVFCSCLAVYQTFYGATVLSFLGGVRLGLTLPPGSSQSPDGRNLAYSVMPLLWSCGALVAGSYMDCVVVGNVGVMLGLGATCYLDMVMLGYPGWYKGLRFCLTVGALLALCTGVVCQFALSGKKKEEVKKIEIPESESKK